MAHVKSGTITYTANDIENTICLAHIVVVKYDNNNRTVIMQLTNGLIVTLPDSDSGLYENIRGALIKYYGAL
jgi:arginine deiminase